MLRRVLLVAVVVLVPGGCGDGSQDARTAAAAPERVPDLEGEVTSVAAAAGDVDGSVLVEAEPGVAGTEKISFTVTSATALLREEGSGFETLAGVDEVIAGQPVRAWAVDGRVAESYPGQAEAEAIVVVGAR